MKKRKFVDPKKELNYTVRTMPKGRKPVGVRSVLRVSGTSGRESDRDVKRCDRVGIPNAGMPSVRTSAETQLAAKEKRGPGLTGLTSLVPWVEPWRESGEWKGKSTELSFIIQLGNLGIS